jgi:hypothetical protein
MIGTLKNHRDERVTVSVEGFVPQDHFLRVIEATTNFDFIEINYFYKYINAKGVNTMNIIKNIFKTVISLHLLIYIVKFHFKRLIPISKIGNINFS